jgi:hypothetical protein
VCVCVCGVCLCSQILDVCFLYASEPFPVCYTYGLNCFSSQPRVKMRQLTTQISGRAWGSSRQADWRSWWITWYCPYCSRTPFLSPPFCAPTDISQPQSRCWTCCSQQKPPISKHKRISTFDCAEQCLMLLFPQFDIGEWELRGLPT